MSNGCKKDLTNMLNQMHKNFSKTRFYQKFRCNGTFHAWKQTMAMDISGI